MLAFLESLLFIIKFSISSWNHWGILLKSRWPETLRNLKQSFTILLFEFYSLKKFLELFLLLHQKFKPMIILFSLFTINFFHWFLILFFVCLWTLLYIWLGILFVRFHEKRVCKFNGLCIAGLIFQNIQYDTVLVLLLFTTENAKAVCLFFYLLIFLSDIGICDIRHHSY